MKNELERRMEALKRTIEESKAKKVKYPTVAMPRSEFKRLPIAEGY